MRTRGLIILGASVGVLALAADGAYWAGRSLFRRRTDRQRRSWRASHRDGADTGPRWIVYTTSPTAALAAFGGEQGAFVVQNQPDPEYAMPAEVPKKHKDWAIHRSPEDSMQESYMLPT